MKMRNPFIDPAMQDFAASLTDAQLKAMDEQFLPMAKDLLDGYGTPDPDLVALESEKAARARVRAAYDAMGVKNLPTAARELLESTADRVLADPETVAYETEKKKAEDAERRGLHKVPFKLKTVLERAGGKDIEESRSVRDENGRLVAVEFWAGGKLRSRKVVERDARGKISGTRTERVK